MIIDSLNSNISPLSAPKDGTINNIVVFIRFSDQSEFNEELSYYDNMFNNASNSMDNYFKEVSYSQLSIHSLFYPQTTGLTVISYQDSQSRSYYQRKKDKDGNIINPNGYENDSWTREYALVKNAVNFIAGEVDSSINIDSDNDGIVDSICFIVKGGSEGWVDLLWPHKLDLPFGTVSINGKEVSSYDFQLEKGLDVGVLCHEMCHTLGFPDLYHYADSDDNPNNDTGIAAVGPWDLMDKTGDHSPQHMGSYMKYKYGTWINSIPQISGQGPHTLNPLTSPTNNSFQIASPVSSSEFFVVEYRRKTGIFESSLPDSGLIIYRINPPDEVFACRAGVSVSNPNGNGPDNANLSIESGLSTLGGKENPILLSNKTDSNLKIIVVRNADNTISFEIADVNDSADLSISMKAYKDIAYKNEIIE